jgi:teichoic acid transport system ATP-binding protein
MGKDSVINLSNIAKTYRLYDRHVDRVKEIFHPLRKKYYHEFKALTGVSVSVNRGDTVGIIGKNGSGKSTLLQIICGIVQPSGGMVETRGRISALLELGAGFNPEFTGRQNVFLNGAIMGLSKTEIASALPDIEAFADIGSFIDQPVKKYSSGMYVRLAFAVAINVSPDILVVDEALAVGDTAFQAKCFAKFSEFQQKGITILFVTHSLDLVTRYCSNAYLLNQGKIKYQGDPKLAVDEYNRLLVDLSKMEDSDETPAIQELDGKREQEWQGQFSVNPNENCYGNGNARIIEGGIFDAKGNPAQVLRQGQFYEFRLKVKFNEMLQEPILAYTIKDVKGFDISGTNTLYQNIKTGTVNNGDAMVVVFKHRILLNPGGYLLSFGCAGYEGGEYIVYERRYDYLTFEVVSERGSVGFFDMDSKIKLFRI